MRALPHSKYRRGTPNGPSCVAKMHRKVHVNRPRPVQTTPCHGFQAGVILSHHYPTPAFFRSTTSDTATCSASPTAPSVPGARSDRPGAPLGPDARAARCRRAGPACSGRGCATVARPTRDRRGGPNYAPQMHLKKLINAGPLVHNAPCHGFQAGVLLSHLPPRTPAFFPLSTCITINRTRSRASLSTQGATVTFRVET